MLTKVEMQGGGNNESIGEGIGSGHPWRSSRSLAHPRPASLCTVPDAVIGVITKYLQPPEVYNLLTVLDYNRKNFNGWKSLAAYFNPPSRSILAASLEKSLKHVIKSNK